MGGNGTIAFILPSDKEGNEHPAVLHMLDVAACAERLIEGHTAFAQLSDAQRQALVILVALHDVGKLSESFRALVRIRETEAPLHWQLSDFLLCGVLDRLLAGLGADEWVRTELYAGGGGGWTSRPTANPSRRESSEETQATACRRKWRTGGAGLGIAATQTVPGCIAPGHDG